jgi:molybdenum cofactor biosynthesis protein B
MSDAMAPAGSGKVIFAPPGSIGARKGGWDKIICWQLDNHYKPCNLVEIMPRFLER